MKRKLLVPVVAVALALSIACASAVTDAYKALGTASVAVDTAMKTYADLVVAGKVSAATQASVKQAYADYQTAMSAAQAAVLIWQAASGTSATFPSAQVNAAIAAAGAVQAKAVAP